MRRPSATTVAKQAGVSQATVSYVLNGKFLDRIPDDTRQRVMAAAEQLGYRPNHLARSLLSGKTRTIGLLLPSNAPYYASLVEGIEAVLDEHDYKLLCCRAGDKQDQEANVVEFFMELRVDGIACVATTFSIPRIRQWLSRVDQRLVPCAILDDSTYAADADCIISDDVAGMKLAVDHLVSLGHRRIAHISMWSGNSTARDRTAGYRLALEQHGIPYDQSIDVKTTHSAKRDEYTESIKSLLAMPDPPTACIPDIDTMFEGFYTECLRNRDLDPLALSVVGYANNDTSRIFDMTAISQNPEQMGAIAARRLLERMDNPGAEPRLIKIQPCLIVRSSCKDLNLIRSNQQ